MRKGLNGPNFCHLRFKKVQTFYREPSHFQAKIILFLYPKMSDTHVMLMFIPSTAIREYILESLGIQTASSFFKMSVFRNLKPISYFFWRLYSLVFYLETIGVR